jgi:7,8-dihydropterin-6-yl-methyl-4-(beta-D-ribofuranosyl)aminobenzene 5'-phosphate synthase
MSDEIFVTVLVENTAQGRGVMGEHGLAFHVLAGGQGALFDTGQSGLVARNASLLGVDLSAVRAVALSHGHYDHSGGLRAVWEQAPDARLFVHPSALVPRFSRRPGGAARAVGTDPLTLQAIRCREADVVETRSVTAVLPGVFLTGEIPRVTEYEDVGGPFVLDEAGIRPDPIADDQAMFFDTAEGIVVLLGCAHAGVVNTLRHIRHLGGGRPIRAVLGGMHLLVASPERMSRTVEALRSLDVKQLCPAHCTGAAATARLWQEFPGSCGTCSVGDRFAYKK